MADQLRSPDKPRPKRTPKPDERSDLRIRNPLSGAAAHRQAKAAGYDTATEYVENLIRADARGPGIRLARAIGDIGQTLSGLLNEARRGSLSEEAWHVATPEIIDKLGRLLAARIDPGRRVAGRAPQPLPGPTGAGDPP